MRILSVAHWLGHCFSEDEEKYECYHVILNAIE